MHVRVYIIWKYCESLCEYIDKIGKSCYNIFTEKRIL